jgi:putative hydrolase of the HAD superfamily
MIKAVCFDGDGVMINKPKRFSDHLSEQHNVPMEKIIPFFEKEFPLVLIGKADLKQELSKYLTQWNWTGSVDDLVRYWFESEHYVNTELVSSIGQLRDRGIVCALTSNQEKYRTEYLKQEMGFARVFDKIFVAAEVGYLKPQQEFWQAVLAGIPGVAKQEVLVWDDEQKTIDEARKFGFNAEVYTDIVSYQTTLEGYLHG